MGVEMAMVVTTSRIFPRPTRLAMAHDLMCVAEAAQFFECGLVELYRFAASQRACCLGSVQESTELGAKGVSAALVAREQVHHFSRIGFQIVELLAS